MNGFLQLDNGETRAVLRLRRRVAPVKAAVLPLVKNNPDIMGKALEIHKAIGRR
jgi:glycyl-tRNA synthetase (class II)